MHGMPKNAKAHLAFLVPAMNIPQLMGGSRAQATKPFVAVLTNSLFGYPVKVSSYVAMAPQWPWLQFCQRDLELL